MEVVIGDSRILEVISRRYGMKFDRNYKYCIKDNGINELKYKGNNYKLRYTDGCFYPFLVRIDEI